MKTQFFSVTIYLSGKDASKEERKSAMKTAVGFISKFQLSSNTKITCMPDMGETALFKTLFKS